MSLFSWPCVHERWVRWGCRKPSFDILAPRERYDIEKSDRRAHTKVKRRKKSLRDHRI